MLMMKKKNTLWETKNCMDDYKSERNGKPKHRHEMQVIWVVDLPAPVVPLIPLLAPDTDIGAVQIRYYNYCDPANPTPLTTTGGSPAFFTLQPLHTAFQTVSGTTLWGPASTPSGFEVTLPDTPCAAGYVPIGMEVRLAADLGAGTPDLDGSNCSALAAGEFTKNRITRISSLRVWPSTPPPLAEPRITTLSVSGGTCAPDALFASNADASCTFDLSVEVDWQQLDEGSRAVPANFSVAVNGVPLAGPTDITGAWTGAITNSTAGRSDLVASWQWQDRDPTHTAPSGEPCNVLAGNRNPCRASGAQQLTSVVLANATMRPVTLARTSATAQDTGGQPRAHRSAQQQGNHHHPVSDTRHQSADQKRRPRDPQAGRVPDEHCGSLSDPAYPAGAFQLFVNGCQPVYAANTFSDPQWWNILTRTCPSTSAVFGFPNSTTEPWRCVPIEPGIITSVLAEGIAASTGNCTSIDSNSCRRVECVNPNNYNPSLPNGGVSATDPRLVTLFGTPFKTEGPSGSRAVPITALRTFYITGWGGGSTQADPCPGSEQLQPGEVSGYFVDAPS